MARAGASREVGLECCLSGEALLYVSRYPNSANSVENLQESSSRLLQFYHSPMCYSAQLIEQYEEYVDLNGAEIDIEAFARLYGFRCLDDRIKIPKAVEASFQGAGSLQEATIKANLEQYRTQQATKLEQELFKQRKRLADAERVLQSKPTKAATESQRISTNKIDWLRGKLADLNRTELTGQDSRIYPGYYAPVMVWENGRRVIKPMRYQIGRAHV